MDTEKVKGSMSWRFQCEQVSWKKQQVRVRCPNQSFMRWWCFFDEKVHGITAFQQGLREYVAEVEGQNHWMRKLKALTDGIFCVNFEGTQN